MDALGEPVARREIAREIIIPAAGNHKLDFVIAADRFEICRVKGFRLARIRALHVHDLDDLAGQHADEPFAARLDHYRIACGEELFGQLRRFRLQQRFAARDLDKRNAPGAISGERAYLREHFVHAVLCASVKRVRRVAPRAAQIAARQTHEYARQSRAGAFPLNGLENFGDLHTLQPRSGGRN